MSGEIFISYRRADQAKAALLWKLLHERGVEAWYDQHVPSGEDWRAATANALVAAPIAHVADRNDRHPCLLARGVLGKAGKCRVHRRAVVANRRTDEDLRFAACKTDTARQRTT